MEDEIYSYFTVEKILVDVKQGNAYGKELRSFAYCTDTKTFIMEVAKKRNIALDQLFVKFGCDGGGNSLKLCVTIASKEELKDRKKSMVNLAGVKKLFLIGIMINTPETHENLRKLFQKCDLLDPTEIATDVWIPTDLKVVNKSIGLQEHSCGFPCCYCEVPKSNFRQNAPSRTFGSIRENNEHWVAAGSDLKQAAQFKNCVAKPILQEIPNCAPVIEIYPPPELHLMLGAFNHIYKKIIQVDQENVLRWTKKCGVTPGGRCGDFNGNQTKKLMARWRELRDYIIPDAAFFVDILGALNSVVDGCFGYDLAEDYASRIDHLEWLLKSNGISLTPKLHIIIVHVKEFIGKFDLGLGYFSEQAGESIHHMWARFFENFKCSTSNEQFESCLIRALVKFNARAF